MKTRVTALFTIDIPIIQAGMVWVSGYKLASAVSNAGGLGLIGSGSMKPELLREHIVKARDATRRPFGVNIPLLREDADRLVAAAIEEDVRIVFTSAGNPGKFIDILKKAGCIVVHVVSSVRQAVKARDAGCDGVVAEGVEAGGHDGVNETATLTLVPQVVDAVELPVMAAGGIVDGRGMAAALALGADGVQIGTRFAVTQESSAHERFKKAVVEAGDDGTILTLKKVSPVRLIRTPFAERANSAELLGASKAELEELLGHGRERKGIFDGDWEEGEFEAGQGSGLIRDIPKAEEVVRRIMEEYYSTVRRMSEFEE
jgi:enoyl-[acyl-carrier protein] reductase II